MTPTTCLHHLFEAQALSTPEQPAVAFEGERLTYAQLNRRADLLAAHLQSLGAGPDVRVGLLVDRSLDAIVGMLGTLKAGAAYVPIDPAYPADRIGFMLEDAGAALVVTQSALATKVATHPHVVSLDTFDWSAEGAPVARDVRPEHLAYVIYTSGSTGKPKGVGIEHRNIVSYVRAVSERLQLEPGMQHATVSTFAADLGNTVVFPALVTGGCLHVIAQERLESQGRLADYFQRERIDVLKIVPSHLAALQTGKNPEHVMPRRRLILGGEASRLDWIARLGALAPACEIFNHYGPTETTVGVLTYHVEGTLPSTASGTLPLGRALANSRVYVLDSAGAPVTGGTEGEICIGGDGVARGYLNRPDLTAEKFIADPFNAGGRMYRTGDRARVLETGDIEFLGRIDHQVKIHGYRIELGEIEASLREQGGIADALVTAVEDAAGDKHLAAYIVPSRLTQPLWARESLHVLPDGAPVAHLNRNETEYIYNEIFTLQAYLRHGVTIKDGDTVLDCGSNIGMFTVFASRLARDLRVVSFEPNPAAYACMSANAQAYGSRVRPLSVGVSSENKTAELTFFEGMSLLSGFYADEKKEREVVTNYVYNQDASAKDDASLAKQVDELIEGRFHARKEIAQLRTLSSVMVDEGIDKVDLLKINVEKSELDVLLGIADADWSKIRQMVIEVDLDKNLDPMKALLESKGYEVFVEQDPLLQKTELCYIYAVRPSAEGRLIPNQPPADYLRVVPPPDRAVLTPLTLKRYLRERLPQYMVPAAFVLLERFPLTSNGKIDRKALPAVTLDQSRRTSPEAARPQTETERALATIWAELLRVEDIGRDDSFFELGGHSLLAIKTVSRIRDVFGVDIPIRVLFEQPTLAGLARLVAEAKGSGESVQRIEPRTEIGPAPLSFSQEQLWFFDQLAPGSPVYNIVDFLTIDGHYDAAAMRRAMNELVRRHDVLRTCFVAGDGQPLQSIAPAVDVNVAEIDLGAVAAEERDARWAEAARTEGRRAFDLTKAPLIAATAVHLSPLSHRVLIVVHHIVADEWSMEIIQQEVRQLYDAFSQSRPSPLAPLPIQYADFATWQRGWLKGEIVDRQVRYWKQALQGAPLVLELPADRPRPAVQSFCGATEFFSLPRPLVDALKSIGRNEQATLFMTLQASFMALLHRYTGQKDILVGTPITGRTQSGTEGLIGYFLNTLILRAQFADDENFRGLVRQVRDGALGAYAHADLPLRALVSELSPERDASRTPLFQVMFVLHDAAGTSQVSTAAGNGQLETGTAKFDLSLITSENEHGLDAVFEYSTDLFDAATVRRMCEHYRTLVEGLVRTPELSIGRQPFVTEAERAMLRQWNATDAPASASCVHELVLAQCARTPDRVAVTCAGQSMTYADLGGRVEAVAARLRRAGVTPGTRVGVFVERGVDMVVGVLAVMKAGGAYVPLDPAFPRERLSYMVKDSGAAVLLAHDATMADVPSTDVPIVLVDQHEASAVAESPDIAATPGDLAYVIYTSGSTGQPKGVAISHRSLVNLLESMGRTPGLRNTDVWLAVTTLSFDIAALELYLPLMTGATIALATRDEAADGQRLLSRMSASGATVLQATPATWRMLIDAGWTGQPALRALCGGEALPRDLANELISRTAEVWNVYGPTETTVWSTVARVTAGDAPITIGQPIANTQCWILDPHGSVMPLGVPGELYIGGAGVARGYWERPALTSERFTADRVTGAEGSRLYRTGDLARWRADGSLECLGRTDHQVKLRGFRIELGEIEACLANHPAVRQAVAIVREDRPGERRLVAYVVPGGPADDLTEPLRAHARKTLPEYMVPSLWVVMDRLPLTPNGKIDRKALPAPVAAPTGTSALPQTPSEALVLGLFHEIIGRRDLGVDDSFFECGGDSLMAARLMTRLRTASGVDLALRHLFERPTARGLAGVLDRLTWAAHAGQPATVTGVREEFVL